MQKIINKGFTLIELLVVIAIIGILAAIVLVSLGNARQQGADAGIKGNLDSIRTQTEIYASSNPTTGYGTVAATAANAVGNQTSATAACAPTGGATGMWTDATIKQAIISAQGNASTASLNNVPNSYSVCGWGPVSSQATVWFIAIPLKSTPANVWCVDNQGKAVSVPIAGYFDSAANTQARMAAGCPSL